MVTANDLYPYTFGLSFRTSIPLQKFSCAWFDDRVYYEFSPTEAKVKLQNIGKALDFGSRASNGFGRGFGVDWKGLHLR